MEYFYDQSLPYSNISQETCDRVCELQNEDLLLSNPHKSFSHGLLELTVNGILGNILAKPFLQNQVLCCVEIFVGKNTFLLECGRDFTQRRMADQGYWCDIWLCLLSNE